MALNTCEMRFNDIKIAFFHKKLQKIAQRLGLCPQTPKAYGGWGPRPKPPVCDIFGLH